MKQINSYILGFFAPLALLFGQAIDQTTIQRQTAPPANVSSGKSSSGPSVQSSNTGMLRPIMLQTKNITLFGAIDSSIALKSNPLTLELEDSISAAGGKDGVWSYTLSGGAILDPYDFGSALVSPVIGGSWTSSDHLNDTFERLNDHTTSAYALLMIQHESGISCRIGSSYAMVRNQDDETEDYSEFYPNVGFSYSIDHGNDLIGVVDVSAGAHLAKSDSFSLDGINYTDYLSNWDYALSYTLNYEFYNVQIAPSYRLSKKQFFKDNINVPTTFGRDDVSHTLSVNLMYPLIEHVSIGANYAHERRNSNVASDYRANNLSTNIGINYSF